MNFPFAQLMNSEEYRQRGEKFRGMLPNEWGKSSSFVLFNIATEKSRRAETYEMNAQKDCTTKREKAFHVQGA